jgi:hypothetical protein
MPLGVDEPTAAGGGLLPSPRLAPAKVGGCCSSPFRNRDTDTAPGSRVFDEVVWEEEELAGLGLLLLDAAAGSADGAMLLPTTYAAAAHTPVPAS